MYIHINMCTHMYVTLIVENQMEKCIEHEMEPGSEKGLQEQYVVVCLEYPVYL